MILFNNYSQQWIDDEVEKIVEEKQALETFQNVNWSTHSCYIAYSNYAVYADIFDG